MYKQKNKSKEIELQNEIEKLLSKKEKMLDLALDGILSKDDLKVKKLTIEIEIEDLKAEQEKIQEQSVKKKEQKLLNKIIVKENELQIVLKTKELINIDMSDKLR